jgi:type VI protein secretion system component Hcp
MAHQMIYLRLEGVDGEEPIGDSQKMIAIAGYSHSLSMPVAPGRPSLGEDAAFRRSYCQHGLFTVTKGFDMTSPKLFAACANGIVFPNAAVHTCSQKFNTSAKSSEPAPMLTITMTDAVMVDFSYGFQGGWQVETISFQYAKIGWKVNWADPETGDPANLEPVGWDGLTNKAGEVSIPSAVKWGSGGLL